MKTNQLIKISLLILYLFLIGSSCHSIENKHEGKMSLKDALKDRFYIGTAMNSDQIWEKDSSELNIIKRHFNSIVAENCMKMEKIQPKKGEFHFSNADKFVEFGEKNNMFIIGHTLIWHSQIPDWFFKDGNGNLVSKEVLIERMKNYITTVVSRYKGRIKGWDVVNEAVMDDGSLRNSKFLQIIGEDYLRLAFEFAHAADPDAELYYNDYSMAIPTKRNGVVAMVKKLQSQGVKISGIGMQGHMLMNFPVIDEFEKSILAFSELGVKVMITELDISILPHPQSNVGAEISINHEYQKELNPYIEGLPDEKAKILQNRYADFFKLFLKHQDKISRVTLWGVCDQNSWKNNWPIKGRTDYPLLFDRNCKPKPIVSEIIELAKKD